MSDVFGEAAGAEAQSGTEKPLTDQERALVTRLLSDPFAFPMVFKTWLINFLEGSDILLPRSSVQGLSLLLGSGGGSGVMGLLPAGLILPWGAVSAPEGALLCNGAAYSRTAYKRLFDSIGTTFGAPDANTFNVPDLRRRLPFGQGASRAIGTSDGLAEASRDINHNHDFGQTSNSGGSHSHGVSGGTDTQGSHQHAPTSGEFALTDATTMTFSPGSGVFRASNRSSTLQAAGGHSHNLSGAGTDTHGGHSHFVSGPTSGGGPKDRPSFLTVGYIINY